MVSFIASCFILSSLIASSDNHAIYIATVEIRASAEAEVNIKVFADDLQDVLRNYEEKPLVLGDETTLIANRQLIEAYFNEHLKFILNNQRKSLIFMDGTKENDVYFLSFKMITPEDWQTLSIKGDFFMEVFPDQSNVFTVYQAEKKQFCRTTKSSTEYTFTFD